MWCLYCVISQGIIALIPVLSLGWLSRRDCEVTRGHGSVGVAGDSGKILSLKLATKPATGTQTGADKIEAY